ncbi:MAG: hypothetical protein EPGJADBJ_00340 [Saprospiraceae bacterium]|nr:hypothetical protein [Saprospiraceae bacterium]
MRPLSLLFLSVFIGVTGCFPDNNPLENDPELTNPEILDIQKDNKGNLQVFIKNEYSASATVVLERKSIGGFSAIAFVKSGTMLLDSTLNKEENTTYYYQFKVIKNNHESDYSNEKSYAYTSEVLNTPLKFRARELESQGILLEWMDNSTTEGNYVLRRYKDVNQLFGQDILLPVNSINYLDGEIYQLLGIPNSPINLTYWIQARNITKSSEWAVVSISYTGFAKPTNLRIVDTNYNHFTIEWIDNSGIEEQYLVERKKDQGNFQVIKQLPVNSQIFVDTITESGVYAYRVRATANSLFSSYSNEVSYSFQNLLPPLLAYYPFNGNANDESGNGYNGDVKGAVLTVDRFGESNKAYYFNGNTYIDIGSNAQIVAIPFSISAWIKPTQWLSVSSPYSSIITKYGLVGFNPKGWYFAIHPTLGVMFTLDDTQFSAGDIQLNEWTHIVVCADGSKERIYINNELSAETIASNVNVSSNNFHTCIGDASQCRPDEPLPLPGIEYESFIGTIDDIRIFGRILTISEIDSLFHEGGW